ncbi:MAG: methionine--tRNA ligase [Nanoarchaeota archaeon]
MEIKKQKKFYITTPIYYINDNPHIGSAYTTVIADIIARWHKLRDEDTFLLTGTDENSQKTVQASINLGFNNIQKYADFMAERWIHVWKRLNIEYNDFIRTTEDRHKNLASEFFMKLYDNKDIYLGKYEGLYCEGCELFLSDEDLVNGLCPLHKKEPKMISEQNYYFKLSKYQSKILKLLEKNKKFIQPESRRNEILNFVKAGLKDISVSRQSLRWGITVPIDDKQKIWIWVEALCNYLHPKDYWPADLHLMGKDIIRPHTIVWPAMLYSAGYKLPKKIFAHGFFTVNGQKMSKSLGNVIDPIYLVDKYGADAIRYYYAREIPFGQDGDFSEESLKNRMNNELANELGNLLSRTLTLVEKNLDGEVKKTAIDKRLFKNLKIKQLDKFMENLEIHNAIAGIMGFVQDCNKYVNDNKPWEIKDKEKLNKVLYNLIEALRITSILIYPFMPETSGKINEQLGITNELPKLLECTPGLLESTKVKKGDVLFKKLEDKKK